MDQALKRSSIFSINIFCNGICLEQDLDQLSENYLLVL